ncbi:hypothetical protein GOBAR_AA00816 [Gossypium barbadense]|uniref:Trichome birefringence-like C-terminal domain-containing protein n=1 Tax=Gossypium barbadense TaxID=3634 RepID=A0A2P5YW37_GOSBA|nr:hypothetical protein GOBAR_AA00816 [Gossypium barbadense]
MKEWSYMLSCRAKELSLIAIIFMAATIIMWTCDKSPVFTFSLLSNNQLLQLSSEPKRHVKEDISMLTQRKVIHNEDEDHLDKTLSIDTKKGNLLYQIFCNYAKGKWVVDDRRPLYRQDFAFEKLRWQPKGCEMKEFEGPKFLKWYLYNLKLRANRWVMYVGGAPNTNKKIANMGRAKNFTIHNTIKWLNSQLPKHPHLKAFYWSISPMHLVNGDWKTGGSCNNTKPMSIGKEVLQVGSSDHAAVSAVRWTGVKLLDITALSQL